MLLLLFRYLYSFERYLRSNSKVVVNRTDFSTFLLSQFVRGRCPKKLYLRYHPHLAARHVAMFHDTTPPGSKVLAANTLHFKPIIDPL